LPVPRILTVRFVQAVKAQAKLVEYGDTSGGRLLVHPSGRKVWVHRYRDAVGRTRKDTLGPAIGPGALTLAAMREAVAKTRRQLEQGVAPSRLVPMTAGDSVASHAAQFLAQHCIPKNRPSTVEGITRMLNNVVLPALGTRTVCDLRRRDVIELAEKVAAERGPGAALHLVRVLSRFSNWLLDRDVIETSFCTRISAVLSSQPKVRGRTLTDAELGVLLKAITDHPSDCAIRILALTGCRRNEVGGMRWSELDPETRIWTIPAERSKNHRDHTVPLSAQVWAIIDAQLRIVGCDYVFTTNGRGPINDWDQVKKRLSVKAELDETGWRLHDLRRTVASGLQRLGVRTEVIERALGHRSGTFGGIVGVYQVDPLEAEVRTALQRWADHAEEILLLDRKPVKGQVVDLRGRRK